MERFLDTQRIVRPQGWEFSRTEALFETAEFPTPARPRSADSARRSVVLRRGTGTPQSRRGEAFFAAGRLRVRMTPGSAVFGAPALIAPHRAPHGLCVTVRIRSSKCASRDDSPPAIVSTNASEDWDSQAARERIRSSQTTTRAQGTQSAPGRRLAPYG